MYIGVNTIMRFTKNMLKLIRYQTDFCRRMAVTWSTFGRKTIIKSFQTVNTIYLYCKQICKSTHLIDGKYINCLYTTPPLVNLTVAFHSPEKILYLPTEYPTRYL